MRAARRARSRLHMGQEEILGVFNHVYLVIEKKKKKKMVSFWIRLCGEENDRLGGNENSRRDSPCDTCVYKA